jgi:hypothetical protein
MGLKKFMSKQLVLRFVMLMILVGGAAVYDLSHASDQKLIKHTHPKPSPQEPDNFKTFFCNQVPVYNLKITPSETTIRFRFACTEDKFLLHYFNLRTFQMMKAEAVTACFTSIGLFHSLPFNKVLYANPDDVPPLA